MRVAAVQLEVQLGDVERNLAECERLARAAAAEGAELIALPEFFSSGAAFLPEVARAVLPPDAAFLRSLARETGAHVGGSYLCRDDDGEIRNAFFLAGPDGSVLGRHDKDLPTMWENALYVGGRDDGIIPAGEFTVGAAVCWEYMRARTATRLQGKVDLVMGGSNWWSVPWVPRWERSNAATALRAPSVFGRYVGAPVVHAAICGAFTCPMPDLPGVTYRGHFEGNALVADATGAVLALRRGEEGSGFVVADVEIGRRPPAEPIPSRYWLHRRGFLAAYAWNAQRLHGRRWYRRQNPARARD